MYVDVFINTLYARIYVGYIYLEGSYYKKKNLLQSGASISSFGFL